jgi:hypothetical protein
LGTSARLRGRTKPPAHGSAATSSSEPSVAPAARTPMTGLGMAGRFPKHTRYPRPMSTTAGTASAAVTFSEAMLPGERLLDQ